MSEEKEVLTPGEVAKRFNVDTKTVNRWAAKGRITSFRTLGGHFRFYKADVDKAVSESTKEVDDEAQ